MKKMMLVLFLIAGAGFGLSGQATDKGNFLVGSQIGLSAAQSNVKNSAQTGEATEESPRSVLISFSPAVGYFLINDLALGIRMDYTINQVKEPGRNRIEDSDLLFGPFGRYYYPVFKDMSLLFELGFGFGNSSDIQDVNGQQQRIKTNIFAAGFGPGITVFSEKAIGIEAMLKYKYARSNFNTRIGGVEQDVLTRTNQIDLFVGVQFYFGGVKKIQMY